LSDTQLGLLTGIGFALFFGIVGIPLGRLVDRWNRRNILALSVGIFSIMTAAAAAAGSFVQLTITRLLVGAGEAGGSPAMLSMISDLYPPHKRAGAVSIYYAGAPIGGMLILFAGGWVGQHYGWRAVFIGAGLPGILLALLLLAIKEPSRQTGGDAATAERAPSFGASIAFIFAQPALRHLLATATITSAATAGLFSFTISYLVRIHDASLTEAGTLMGAGYGIVGFVSSIVSGRVVDRLASRDERWRAWFCALSCFLTFPAVALMVKGGSFAMAGAGLAVWAMMSVATYGPLMALLQSLVGVRMRGTVSAIFYFLSYFVGVSLGPQLIGLISDGLAASQGIASLSTAMLAVGALYWWGAVHFLLAARTLRSDLKRAEAA